MTDWALLSQLWLHEPEAATIDRATRELGLPSADAANLAVNELAIAFADLFLLNVFPYGTVFTDEWGELNGSSAEHIAALYEAHGYHPPELTEVAAPDHLGLCLGFLAFLSERGLESRDDPASLLEWAPVCCLTIEHESGAHPFYRALAARTREALLGGVPISVLNSQDSNSQILNPSLLLASADEEISLRSIVRFFLAPAQCGWFLSRACLGQIAKSLGMRLPFGSRFEVAENLFAVAGESIRLEKLLETLHGEVEIWSNYYRTLAENYPGWQWGADRWLRRLTQAARMLAEMEKVMMTEALEN